MPYKAYKFRIYPNQEQKLLINKTISCARLVFNLVLADNLEKYKACDGDKEKIKKIKLLTAAQLKKDPKYIFLKEVDSSALNYSIRDYQAAMKNFFRDPKVGFPKFKSKGKDRNSYTTQNKHIGTSHEAIRFLDNKHLRFPILKSIKIVKHRKITGRIVSATISIDPSGKYYVSLQCEVEQYKNLPETNKSVGVDLGISHLAILSNGEKIENHRLYNKAQQKLAREQRKLSRMARLAKERKVKLRDAKNYQKQKIKVAKIHEKIKLQRDDLLEKLTKRLVKEFDIICIEDLSSSNLMKNKKLAKNIANVSWYNLALKLQQKADMYGKEIVKIDRFYPSSQVCSVCGHRDGKKDLSIREWTCPECHAHLDRDINAAVNILNEGLRIREEMFN